MALGTLLGWPSYAWAQANGGIGGGSFPPAIARVDPTGGAAGGAGAIPGGGTGGTGIRAVTRPARLQNQQVLVRNFFGAAGVALPVGNYVPDDPAGTQGAAGGAGGTIAGVRTRPGSGLIQPGVAHRTPPRLAPNQFRRPTLAGTSAPVPTPPRR